MVVPYGAEYPEYLDEDGDWMTAFPRDKTPFEILQETQERMRQHERTQAILNRRNARLRRQAQNTNSNPRFLTDCCFSVQTLTDTGWNIICETDELEWANSVYDYYASNVGFLLTNQRNITNVRIITRSGNILFIQN